MEFLKLHFKKYEYFISHVQEELGGSTHDGDGKIRVERLWTAFRHEAGAWKFVT